MKNVPGVGVHQGDQRSGGCPLLHGDAHCRRSCHSDTCVVSLVGSTLTVCLFPVPLVRETTVRVYNLLGELSDA